MQQTDILGLFPFHLAATYLDGTKVCCQIFHTLFCVMGPQYLNQLYVNNLGHTVLDCLMVSILKSHTTSYPSEYDTAWTREGLFSLGRRWIFVVDGMLIARLYESCSRINKKTCLTI